MERLDPTSWRRQKDLFQAALDVPSERRAEFLDDRCGGDAALRAEVDSLLRCDADAGSFIEQPAMALLARDEPASTRPRLSPGSVLGRYDVLGFLGAGGIGEVYKARDTKLDRLVALKLVSDPGDIEAGRRLLQEARHASRLAHPGICGVHEVDEIDGLPFIVLEYVDGQTLRERLRGQPPGVPDIVGWGIQIAEALDHAHRRGIVHRDLKASNIALADGRVKVLDFGLSRRTDQSTGPSSPASILSDASVAGTLTHIAPEVLRGGGIGPQVDLWALGVVLYELAAGRLPFGGATSIETADAILHQAVPPLPATLPRPLAGVIERALEKDPQRRFASAAAARDALAAVAIALPAVETSRSSRTWGLAAALLASVVALVYVAVPARGPVPSVRPLVAVLPFDEPSAVASEPLFGAGFTEGVAAELGRIDGVRVIATASTAGFGRRADAIADVARATGATSVVRGSVVRSADGVRVAAELLDAVTGRVLWSEEYDRPVRTLQALHGVVAETIARVLAVEPPAADLARFAAARAVAPDVYEAFLKGRYYWTQRTGESLRQAAAAFQSALALDPSYAPAYAALADCYNLLGTVMVGGGSPREWRPRAAEAAIKALQIDPDLAEAHATLGYIRHYNWEWEAAEQSLRRALDLNPSHALARIWYANLLSSRLRLDEAVAQVRIAAELDPLSPVVNTNVGWVLFMARQNAAAIEQYQRTLALAPRYVQAHARLGDALAMAGRHAEAVAAYRAAADIAGHTPSSEVALAQAYALAGRRAEARTLLDRVLAAKPYVSPGAVANVYVALGSVEPALTWLRRSVDERANNVAYLAVEPLYDRIRDDPRFAALRREAGLP